MQKREQPIMILLAGPNGAGKTTFRQNFLETNLIFSDLKSLNWDDETLLVHKEKPELPLLIARIEAGKKIIQMQRMYTEQKNSFVYETVAADKRHLRIIKNVKDAGFKVVTIFIGLTSPDLSKLRVKHRVEHGGHDVPVSDIEARYPKIIANFPNLLSESDTCFVIDNSGKNFKLILLKSSDLSITFSKFPNYLPHNQFDITKEKQTNGSILLTSDTYAKKTPTEKQLLIQHLLELFSLRNL